MSRRAFHFSIVLLLLFFALVVWQRDRIRAHYWGLMLSSSRDIAEQGYYLARLSALGPQSHGALQRLSHSESASVRNLAIYALQRLPPHSAIEELVPLLDDVDESVRDSAATALAFMGKPDAVAALSRAAAGECQGAAAAVAALARVDSPEAIHTLCAIAISHSRPLVRAQAIEALMDGMNSAEGRLASPHDPTATAAHNAQSPLNPVRTLIDSLADTGRFAGLLKLESQRQDVAKMAGAMTRPSTPASRTVSQVAAACLSELTGHPISADKIESEEGKKSMVEQCQRWIHERFQRPLR